MYLKVINKFKLCLFFQLEWEECAEFVTKGMYDGWLRPVIAREYAMEEIQLAHEHLMKKHGHLGKLVLKIS